LTTKKLLQKTVSAYNKAPSAEAAAAELGVSVRIVRSRLSEVRANHEDITVRDPIRKGPAPVSEELLREAVNSVALYGTISGAADVLGLSPSTLQSRIKTAKQQGIEPALQGSDDARKPVVRPLPGKGKIARYYLTCAQNNTLIHEPTWAALQTGMEHDAAEMFVSTFTYNKAKDGSSKRGSRKGSDGGAQWYDERIEPYVVDEMIQLAPGLIWNGHFNNWPTASEPLSALQNYNFRNSSIFPHVRQHMTSIATSPSDAAKLQYTTGTITKRNYIQRKAGQKAEFDHIYGALIVEVNDKGQWWVRQLNTDNAGAIYDVRSDGPIVFHADGRVVRPKGTNSLVWGDIHEIHLGKVTRDLCWGDDGVLDTLRPARQVYHDLADFEFGHHNRRDPYKMFALRVVQGRGIEKEYKSTLDFLTIAGRVGVEDIIVNSNHDRHFERYLREVDWRFDLDNAEFCGTVHLSYLKALRAGASFNAMQSAIEYINGGPLRNTKWLEPGQSYVVCKNDGGGIELGFHGDQGPGGARGSLKNLSLLGRKVIIGHGHGAGILNGAWQVGVMVLDLDYAKGSPGNWSISFCVVHDNGKRQMITVFDDKWHA